MITQEYRKRYSALDGLRGIAILMVIYQHAYAARFSAWLSSHGYRPFIIADAWIGVSLFFVLSGFVLTLPFVGRERASLTVHGITNFLRRRAKRLLPIFLFVSVIGFAIFVPSNPGALLLTISTLHMFVPSQFFPLVNGPFWSLSVEIWASVALPFLILLAARFGYLRVLILVAVLALCVRLLSTLPGLDDPVRRTIRDSVFGRLDEFAAGMMVAWLFANGYLKATRHWMIVVSVPALGAGCLLLDFVKFRPSLLPLQPFAYATLTLSFSLLVAYALSERNMIRRALESWPLQVLGLMCFSLYSWHVIFLSTIPRTDIIGELCFWFVTLSISAATYAYIEFPNSPVQKLFRLNEPPVIRAPQPGSDPAGTYRFRSSQANKNPQLRF